VEPEPPQPSHTLTEYAQWRDAVLTRHEFLCAVCDSAEALVVQPLVPFQAGGGLTPRNGTVLCRRCAQAAATPQHGKAELTISFYVSRALYGRMDAPGFLRGFPSRGALLRHLMDAYLRDPQAYLADLDKYRDVGVRGDSVKIAAWVPPDTYQRFRGHVRGESVRVTNVLRALLLMFEEGGIVEASCPRV